MIAFPKTAPAPIIPPRTRRRIERKLLASNPTGLVLQAVERHNAFIALLPYADGYTSAALNVQDAVNVIDFFARSLTRPEDVPAIASLLHTATFPLRCERDRLDGELQVARWRIMHLEREAAARVPAYSDATAIVLIGGAS